MNELYGFEGEVKHKGIFNSSEHFQEVFSRTKRLPLIPDAFPVAPSRISDQQARFGDAWRPPDGRQYHA